MIKSTRDTRDATVDGALAGLTAGLVLTSLMSLMSIASHKDIWYGMKGAAAPFLGERAMLPGFDAPAVLIGLASHFAVSAIWGALFAVFCFGLSRGATMIAGIAWGIVVWIGMYYAVLPLVGLEVMRSDAPVARAIGFHVFYSTVMAAMYLAYRATPHGSRRFRHAHSM